MDVCYTKKKNGKIVIFVIYVDDVIFLGDMDLINEVIKILQGTFCQEMSLGRIMYIERCTE